MSDFPSLLQNPVGCHSWNEYENLSNVEALNLSIKEHLAQKDLIKGLYFTLYFT